MKSPSPARKVSAIAIVSLLTGCATADFTPYSGAQSWPVAQGAFVETKYDVPVYHGTPDRPYRVLGLLSADTAPVRQFAVVAFMARRTRELGGDALILLDKRKTYAGSIKASSAQAYVSGNTLSIYGNTNTFALFRGRGDGVVIKFPERSARPASSVESSGMTPIQRASQSAIPDDDQGRNRQ